jgi:uncharacterized protein (DUF58 family)
MGRRWVVLWLAVLLVLTGIVARSGAILALSLPVLIYIGAALLMSPGRVSLDIQRFQNAHFVHAGAPVNIKLTVANEGAYLPEVEIRDELPPGLAEQTGSSHIRAAFDRGEKIDFDYSIDSRRGIHKFNQVEIISSDPFGLFPQHISVVLYNQLSAIPAVQALRSIHIQPQQTRPYPGPIRSRKGGSGTDFFGIREYQAGDPMRWVNWQVTARHAEDLFTNQFEQENIADVGIIVDARHQTDVTGSAGSETLFEYSIRIAAALADAFLRDGNRVSLLVYGYGMDRVFPGYGKAQRERILRCLAQARTGQNYPLETLNYLPTRLFPARSQLVMVSPLSRHDAPQLIQLKAAGYDVLIVSPDPVDFQARAMADQPFIVEAVKLAQVERALLLKKLFRAGIKVVDWKVDQPVDRAIQTATRQQRHAPRPVRWQR